VIGLLRRSGFAVERVTDILNARSSDLEILAAARASEAVLLTHDQDFSSILASSGATGPSLVNLRTVSLDPEFLAGCVARALHEAAVAIASGAVVTVEDGGIRIRRLPISGR
jgi:predicted nuclease of predicted toxin-antitoxin system